MEVARSATFKFAVMRGEFICDKRNINSLCRLKSFHGGFIAGPATAIWENTTTTKYPCSLTVRRVLHSARLVDASKE
jgi:hypothetical protein